MSNDAKLISNLTRGTTVCDRAWEADRALSWMRGLLGRRMLAPGEGLLLQPAPSIHTAGMRFPIDVVFLDREFHVVKVVDRLRPWRIAGASQARSALELAPGEAELRGVSVGDRLAALDRPLGWVERTYPIGVLLISKDVRFSAVAGELLRHRGFTVASDERTTDVPQLARRVGAEVIVLDAEAPPDSIGSETLEIEKGYEGLGLVVVGKNAAASAAGVRALAKWGSVDVLERAIEDARPDRRRVS